MTVEDRFTEEARAQRIAQAQLGTFNEIVTGPVSDWTTDFSHTEPEYNERAFEIWEDLRGRCPIAHTERFGGAWLPVRYEDVQAIAYDTEHFTSRAIIVGNYRPPLDLAPVGGVPPISSDPPFHHDARKLLLPACTKSNVAKQAVTTEAFCHSLIDGLEGRDVVDAATEYAMHIPMRVISDMLGFPPEDGPKFAEFVDSALEGANGTPEERQESGAELFDYKPLLRTMNGQELPESVRKGQRLTGILAAVDVAIDDDRQADRFLDAADEAPVGTALVHLVAGAAVNGDHPRA